MKYPLTMDLVKRLKLDQKPAEVDSKGKIIYEDNALKKEYFIFCSSQNSPKGFGVRVAAGTGKKTWIIQRRNGDKVVRSKIGDCADWPIDLAARRRPRWPRDSGDRPESERDGQEDFRREITICGAMTAYKTHLQTRAHKKAKENTISNFERAERRFKEVGWWDRRIRDISTSEVMETFKLKIESAPTANEQNFNWLSLSTRHALDQEALDAAAANRPQTLSANPLKILHLKGMYRSTAQVEAQRELNNSRNPLGPTTTLGPFLEAMWARRDLNDNATGVDFCVVELAVGARRGELSRVRWAETLSDEERAKGAASHVWLDEGEYGPYMFFDAESTKNRRAHRIPLPERF